MKFDELNLGEDLRRQLEEMRIRTDRFKPGDVVRINIGTESDAEWLHTRGYCLSEWNEVRLLVCEPDEDGLYLQALDPRPDLWSARQYAQRYGLDEAAEVAKMQAAPFAWKESELVPHED